MSHDSQNDNRTKTTRFFILGTIGFGVATALVAYTLVTMAEHKAEEKSPYLPVVEITDEMDNPEVWGQNFPLHYDDYKKTTDQVRTRFGGSEAVPRTPTKADPRSIVAQSRLEEDPRLKEMWAGYAFSHDFREERGHAWMLSDQIYTERQLVTPQPGTCVHCHASVYVPYKKAGDGDLFKGFEKLNSMPYAEAVKHMNQPVACIDCHEPKTMKLRVTRPGFIEGIRALKASQGIKDYDPNKHATRQEMRSFVCGQCHVEYYFQGKEKRLVYPWAKGIKVEDIYAYYQDNQHKDWTHAITGAPVLKAQHPEFEMWNQGIHAKAGVACADCHMPYKRVGAMKVSDHHVQSPLLNIGRACQTCHSVSESELMERATAMQTRVYGMRDQAMNALTDLIRDIKAAKDRNGTEAAIQKAQQAQRKAQFYLDFVEAENSTGFHAPQEALRILGESINASRLGQVELAKAAK